ncbi:MAG: glycerophosphodiester phosphodiesterase family protein [Melioribacteraceae bacterium]
MKLLFSISLLFLLSEHIIAQNEEVFWRFPKPKNGNTYVIAHRGAHNNIPENTIAAYKKAIELGCDFIEIDVRKTKDGKFVSIHNSKINEYVEGISGNISEFTLCELKKINIGKESEKERIPTLEEIFELCKGKIRIYLDLKETYINEIVDLVKKYKMEKDIIWYIPFSYVKEIEKLQEICVDCIPMPDPESKANLVELFEKLNPIIIATDMSHLDEEFVKISHKKNIKVFVDEKIGNEFEWNKIIQLGTDGIQTDSPEKLVEFLNRN